MELEYYNSSNQPLKIKKRLRLQKQVAVACLGAYVFLLVNFLMGIFNEPVEADCLGAYKSSARGSDITVCSNLGNFRCTQKTPADFEAGARLKLWQTPFYKTTIKAQILKPDEGVFWCIVNVYIVFSFFPILGLIGATLCLLAKNDFAVRYGFQLSIFSAIMLVFSCLMLGMI